ncbi:MAG: DUF3990 domain-containing protein [Clostridia bacterium]|nr:DUF3990 domain-containing protein [Clostridia bacterium]
MVLEKGLCVYHGSYTIVEKPQLEICKPGKDFGLGFYVTTDIEQARRFVKLSVGKARKNGVVGQEIKKGYVSVYEIVGLGNISCFEFPGADKEWLHCVAAHRKEPLLPQELVKWKSYELIAGKIANDNTNRVITGYINGIYGEVGSDSADRIAISLLEPENLTDQICFRTANALKALKYAGFEEVPL